MLCHEYKFIFVHIPKTGGQSIDNVFLPLVGLTWETRFPLLLGPNSDPNKGPEKFGHLKAYEYVACGHITQEQFDSYFKFSFVRNPWDRIVSIYKYRGWPKKCSFKEFLFKYLIDPDFQKQQWWFMRPQYDFLFKDNNQLVDYVGRFENLQADFDYVCSKLDIPQTPLPHINKSGTKFKLSQVWRIRTNIRQMKNNFNYKKNTFKHYTEYYDSESKELIEKLYQKDIEAFNYEFGKGTSQQSPRQ
ncbi:MAG: sulfotransferase family 2 domain-containing protein [Coleofasciculus sp. A1-SPW-01]|uniref:sulfotransferase family 2 domain-containing protein n=1 Tax=Coleofasciculus sp. A1-SPW-01 TaxID=3070819 RepID=UPI0033054DC4